MGRAVFSESHGHLSDTSDKLCFWSRALHPACIWLASGLHLAGSWLRPPQRPPLELRFPLLLPVALRVDFIQCRSASRGWSAVSPTCAPSRRSVGSTSSTASARPRRTSPVQLYLCSIATCCAGLCCCRRSSSCRSLLFSIVKERNFSFRIFYSDFWYFATH